MGKITPSLNSADEIDPYTAPIQGKKEATKKRPIDRDLFNSFLQKIKLVGWLMENDNFLILR